MYREDFLVQFQDSRLQKLVCVSEEQTRSIKKEPKTILEKFSSFLVYPVKSWAVLRLGCLNNMRPFTP